MVMTDITIFLQGWDTNKQKKLFLSQTILIIMGNAEVVKKCLKIRMENKKKGLDLFAFVHFTIYLLAT